MDDKRFERELKAEKIASLTWLIVYALVGLAFGWLVDARSGGVVLGCFAWVRVEYGGAEFRRPKPTVSKEGGNDGGSS